MCFVAGKGSKLKEGNVGGLICPWGFSIWFMKFFEQEMPPLYKGWFSQSGILATQIQDVARSCVQRGDQKLEICFPPVPNVDEVKFGTRLNSMFAEDISVYLKMEDDLKKVKRYLIEFSNAYWAARLAEAFPDRSVWILFSDSVKKDSARFPPNVEKVCALRRFEERENLGDNDIVIIVDPGPTENWKKGNEFAVSSSHRQGFGVPISAFELGSNIH